MDQTQRAERKRQKGMQSTFGRLLRHWRGQRRMSQLHLAIEAEVSSRHVSFRDAINRFGDAETRGLLAASRQRRSSHGEG